MNVRDFVAGLFCGCIIAIAAVISHDYASDATPVYESGYEDGFHEAMESFGKDYEGFVWVEPK